MIMEVLRKTTNNGWAAEAAQLLLAWPGSPKTIRIGATRADEVTTARGHRR
jgi:hypothetical protein